MISPLLQVLDAIAGCTVLVIGEAMLDSYSEGFTGRLCREAPVPIVTVRSRVDCPGAAANVAANIAALGGRPVLLTAIGADPEAGRLAATLAERGMPTRDVLVDPRRATLAKQRVLGDGQLLVRFDQGSTEPVSGATEDTLLQRLAWWFPRADAVVVSDYGYGILTPRVIARLTQLQSAHRRVMVVDAKNLGAYAGVGATAAKPNCEEAARMLGIDPGPEERIRALASRGEHLLRLTGTRCAVVTLDADGALAIESERPPYRAYAHPVRRARTAGAGDTFGAALAVALAGGAHVPAATDFASAAAAVVVGKDGTAVCHASELRTVFAGQPKQLPDLAALRAVAEDHRRRGNTVVLTNGCFDILHRGHITCLNAAKALGDTLIVAVNSDRSVRRLKGATRPVNTLEDRMDVLAALSCVDHVVAFDDDGPEQVIRTARPDVFVKGGDYAVEQLPEAPLVRSLGGTVRIVPYVNDRSTSDIISRIRRPQPERVA